MIDFITDAIGAIMIIFGARLFDKAFNDRGAKVLSTGAFVLVALLAILLLGGGAAVIEWYS